jgi:hypothetical protein
MCRGSWIRCRVVVDVVVSCYYVSSCCHFVVLLYINNFSYDPDYVSDPYDDHCEIIDQ